MKGSKVSITLAATALAVALFAATPISQAAGRLVLGKNSVGTAQLKKNAVTTVKVRNGSLLTADFKAGQLPAGPQGPKGDPGATGLTGPTGPTGPSDGFVSSTIGPITINGATTIRSLTSVLRRLASSFSVSPSGRSRPSRSAMSGPPAIFSM